MAIDPTETETVTTTERRKHLRAPLIVFKVGNGRERYFFGYAQTLSVGGLFVASINPKPVGERFPIEFTLPGTQEIIRCMCEVVWRRCYDSSSKLEPGFGVRFIDLSEVVQERISSWIQHSPN